MTKSHPATAGTRETWLAWLPPGHPEPPLITRGELLATLARRGLVVTERQLRAWETAGALPAPLWRRLDRAPRPLYPVWYAEVVEALPRSRTSRGSLAQLRPRLRARFEQAAQQASRAESARRSHPLLPAGVIATLQRLMADLNARGAGVEAAELRLLRSGEPSLSYTLPTRAPDPNERHEG